MFNLCEQSDDKASILKPPDLLALRRTHKLHPSLESRLQELLSKVQPDGYALPEGWGISRGRRADLVVYLHDRHVVHIEIFGGKSTVDRDLVILLQSDADVKIALLMDREADPRVAEAYFRGVAANRFPWFWLSQFLDPAQELEALSILEGLLKEATEAGGPLTAQSPAASVHPSAGSPFSRTTLRVSGFHPDHDFTTFWDPNGSTTLLAMGGAVGIDGSGECEFVIPHGGIAKTGDHVIRAVDSLGNAAETKFRVATAWPSPSLRAVPSKIRPGETLALVGGGAPKSIGLSIMIWNGQQGFGIPDSKVKTDERGEFEASLEFPWLLNYMTVMPKGRLKLSLICMEGGLPYEAITYIEVLHYSPPGTFEWISNYSTKWYDIALIRPRFLVADDRILVSLPFRNDRDGPIVLLPFGMMSIVEMSQDLQEEGYGFECIDAGVGTTIDPGQESECRLEFRRLFDVLPQHLIPPIRQFIILVPVRLGNDDVAWIRISETFPLEIWSSGDATGKR